MYAHRGDRSRAADNTLEAFELAVDAGADGIEMDVQATADGELIIAHDPRHGTLPPFCELSFAELRDAAPEVPTLEETLLAVPRHIFLNIEVKADVVRSIPTNTSTGRPRNVERATLSEQV